jgi:transcriptional regulator with XRE-family HTH domain
MQDKNVIPGTFSHRLQICLDEKGWTKTELSRRLDLTHPAVLKWWKGQEPRSETLFKMAALFSVNPQWLSSGLGSKRGPVTMTKEEIEQREAEGLREQMPIYGSDYGTDWKTRALAAEQNLTDLKTSLAELLTKH